MTLDEFFIQNPHIALAYSGGTDSHYLLAEALRRDIDVLPLFVRTPFVSLDDFNSASQNAKSLGMDMSVVDISILDDPEICANPSNRCYMCKMHLFSALLTTAQSLGYPAVMDGTNASDDIHDRPGMRALMELGIRSPLRECGITKRDIRIKSRELGLNTWAKPANACLATRIPAGEMITLHKLAQIASAEKYMSDMGFHDFRVRMAGNDARLEVTPSQIGLVIDKRQDILNALSPFFDHVTLSLTARPETELI